MMKIRIFVISFFLLNPFLFSQSETPATIEEQVLAEINFARKNPQKYADFLKERVKYYDGKKLRIPGRKTIMTYEGLTSLNDAIAFLKRQGQLDELILNAGLSKAAFLLADDQRKTGIIGHLGSDGKGFVSRIEKYVDWVGSVAENIGYGSDAAREIVFQLIVDDGVTSRGHRKNLFNPKYKFIGIAMSSHPKWKHVCVMDFAEGIKK